MKVGDIKQAVTATYPLFSKGDKFKILSIIEDDDLLPIEAMKLKNGQVYYFEEGDLE